MSSSICDLLVFTSTLLIFHKYTYIRIDKKVREGLHMKDSSETGRGFCIKLSLNNFILTFFNLFFCF